MPAQENKTPEAAQEIIFEIPGDVGNPDFDGSQSPMAFSLTPAAIDKLKTLKAKAPLVRLRVRVKAGGCSGFQYEFSLDEMPDEQSRTADVIVTDQNIEVLVDEISAAYLQDARLDYARSLAGENFQIINPNAKNSCGCGVSFSF